MFRYHPKCKRLNLTHLSFADDHLVFVRGDVDSIVGVRNLLDLFYRMSGLKVNEAKTEIYGSGMSREVIEELKMATDFKEGCLRVSQSAFTH